MCGRFGLEVTWAELVEYFNIIRPTVQDMKLSPRFNIAPTQPIIMVGNGADGAREAIHVRWGFLPGWVKDPKEFTLIVNARSETVAEKPSFRSAIRHRRMIVPASGFYEWKRFGKGQKSQPYWVRPKNGGLLALGGLMETWADPNGSEIDTGCVLTTHANASFSSIHHRLPVIVQPDKFEQWLDCKTQEPRDVTNLMEPVEDDFLECIAISDLVNKVSNAGPEVQQPVEVPPCEEQPAHPENSGTQLSMFE